MKRRRFLTLSAACLAVPQMAQATPHRWQGRALGAEAELVLHGSKDNVAEAMTDLTDLLQRVEQTFSLFEPTSEISRLNKTGSLDMSPWFADVVTLSDRLFHMTDGLFDPTVQTAWRDRFEGRAETRDHLGWDRIEVVANRITLAPNQALTFNGIAQGYATDLVSAMLRKRGFGDILVNIGELSGYGRPWKIGFSDPSHGYLGTRTLENHSIATSSPAAMLERRGGHILHPKGLGAKWSTISVEADRASIADGLSTALCLADATQIEDLHRQPNVFQVTTVDHDGNIRTF